MNAEERRDLHEAVVGVCGEPPADGWHPEVWRALDEIGVTALPVSEEAGGGGAGLSAATTVLIALGSVAASVPAVETGLLAGWLLDRTGAELPGGVLTAAVADGLEIRPVNDGWLVSGTVTRVPWARCADRVVLLSPLDGGHCVVVVPLAGAEIRPGVNVAWEPRDDVTLSSHLVPAGDLHRVESADGLAADFSRRAAFGRAAQMAGAAQGVYERAVRYAGQRHQFGRPLAALQAVQQQLAELAAEASAMTVAVEAAASAVDQEPAEDWPLEAARVRVAEGARTVAAIGHQIHGAIGFTDEHPLHLLTTRLWAWREEYGNQATWCDRLGTELTWKDGTSLWQRITG
ncbi:acyl-CoA dehydrogenase family protein [Streptosporangium sp. NPDC001681]|uniref:acyl-CoA dehydrogenase family protein n=1 Tax=Streptosporangium sp. NPDC001681 TaxID=3154395 RepID=UPI0033291EA5